MVSADTTPVVVEQGSVPLTVDSAEAVDEETETPSAPTGLAGGTETTTAPVQVVEDGSCSGTLKIDRRYKEVGQASMWVISHNGRHVCKLGNGSLFVLQNIRRGDEITIELRGAVHKLSIETDKTELVVRLKQKVQVRPHLTGVEEIVWIEPSTTGNQDLEEGLLSWHPANKSTWSWW